MRENLNHFLCLYRTVPSARVKEPPSAANGRTVLTHTTMSVPKKQVSPSDRSLLCMHVYLSSNLWSHLPVYL